MFDQRTFRRRDTGSARQKDLLHLIAPTWSPILTVDWLALTKHSIEVDANEFRAERWVEWRLIERLWCFSVMNNEGPQSSWIELLTGVDIQSCEGFRNQRSSKTRPANLSGGPVMAAGAETSVVEPSVISRATVMSQVRFHAHAKAGSTPGVGGRRTNLMFALGRINGANSERAHAFARHINGIGTGTDSKGGKSLPRLERPGWGAIRRRRDCQPSSL